MSVAYGPVFKLSDKAGTDKLYIDKFRHKTCCVVGCTKPLTDDETGYVWSCKNVTCNAKAHIMCMRRHFRDQSRNNNVSNYVIQFICPNPGCDAVIANSDIRRIDDLSFDELVRENHNLRQRIADLEIKFEQCRHATDVLKKEAQQARLEASQARADALEYQKHAEFYKTSLDMTLKNYDDKFKEQSEQTARILERLSMTERGPQ